MAGDIHQALASGERKQAVEFLCAHGCWGHRLRGMKQVAKFAGWWQGLHSHSSTSRHNVITVCGIHAMVLGGYSGQKRLSLN